MIGIILKQKGLSRYYIMTKDRKKYHLHSNFDDYCKLDENNIASDYVGYTASFEAHPKFSRLGFDGVVDLDSFYLVE